MQTDPIIATERRSGRSFAESSRDGQFDELCRRNGGMLAQREFSNNSLGVHPRDMTSAGFKFVGTWCQVMSLVISWIFAILFVTKTLNSLGGCQSHANTIDESDRQWKVQSKSITSLASQPIKAFRKVLILELLRHSMEVSLTWHRTDGLSILHWSPIASIDTLHKLTC